MSTLNYQKSVELFGEYDIAVIGGGPAGVCAAIEAARCGKRVFLGEATGMLGGYATNALVGPLMTCYDRDGNERVVRGLFDEIVERLIELGGGVSPDECDSPSRQTSFIKKYHRHVTPFDSFALQVVLDRMVNEAGVKTLLYTKYVDSVLKDGRIDSVIFSAPEGLIAVRAKLYIDCTGNADVAAASGVPTWHGSEEGFGPQPATLFFEVDGADDAKYQEFAHRPPMPVKAYQMPMPGTYKVNHERVYGVDANSAESMTAGHMQGREQVLGAFAKLITTPGFENARISQVAPNLGVRESRHIKGRYMMTVADLGEGRVFDDAIAVFGYGMDVHSRDGQMAGGFHGEVAPKYTIPYRCMLPLGCDNLIVAGKCVCGESEAAGSYRVMPGCMAMGQAAGAAAAQAVENGEDPAEIDTEILRATLRSHGAIVDA